MKNKIKKCIVIAVLSLLTVQAASALTASFSGQPELLMCSDKDTTPFSG